MKTLPIISINLIIALALGCTAPVQKPTFSKTTGADSNPYDDGESDDGEDTSNPVDLPNEGDDTQQGEGTDTTTTPDPKDNTGDTGDNNTDNMPPDTKPPETKPDPDAGTPAIGTKDGEWKLVWKEEFNGDKVDDKKWTFEVQKPGWVNNELQNYTNNRKENVRLENGSLILEARRDNFEGHEYSSGRIKTQGKAAWKYGKMEARIQLPGGLGTWPAFWMMPENQSRGWPACGEIDIMEEVGFDQDMVHATTHTLAYNWANNNVKTASTPQAGVTSGFHTYTLIWVQGKIEMYIDGRKYYTVTDEGKGDDAWPFNKEFHIILNLAVGGVWGGMKGVDANIWPRQMKVDWVRVWQKS